MPARYSFTYDHPLNNEFVAAWKKEYGNVPDTFEGEQWQCMKVFEAGITKAGGIEAAKLRPALEDIEIESVKGKGTRMTAHLPWQPSLATELPQKRVAG